MIPAIAILLLFVWVVPLTNRMLTIAGDLRDDFGYVMPHRVDELKRMAPKWFVRVSVVAALLLFFAIDI